MLKFLYVASGIVLITLAAVGNVAWKWVLIWFLVGFVDVALILLGATTLSVTALCIAVAKKIYKGDCKKKVTTDTTTTTTKTNITIDDRKNIFVSNTTDNKTHKTINITTDDKNNVFINGVLVSSVTNKK